MEEVAVKLMKKFFAATKKKPERVIFFRDGVSEGQFDDVVRREAGAIKRKSNLILPETWLNCRSIRCLRCSQYLADDHVHCLL